MSNASMISHTSTMKSSWNGSYYLIELKFSSNIRSIRDLVQVMIVILFISILVFVYRQYQYSRITIRPFSHLSRMIISIGIIGLVLNDFLVINGITHRIWCSCHQISLHILLITIVSARLLPTIYEYAEQYDHKHSISTIRSSMIIGFLLVLLSQLFISIRWLFNHQHLPDLQLDPAVLCLGSTRPQLFILLLHIFDLILTIQSIRTPIITDDFNGIPSIHEKFCHLHSILLRLFYFLTSSILQTLFLPGQFSGTLYSGILVIEYLFELFLSHFQIETNLDNPNGMIHSGYLRLKNDDLSDDTRLLNDID